MDALKATLSSQQATGRKPYTITKTRERWSEEEHALFLEGLRMHGRTWRKIEELIGTKSAVQIRSHAQKFFDKVERTKDSGTGAAASEPGEIEIPPPRPKRKPARPYPKKSTRDCGQNNSADEAGTVSENCMAAIPSPSMNTSARGYQHAQATNMGSGGAMSAQTVGVVEVSEATVAAVAAAASAAAAAAAAAVVASAGSKVRAFLQANPPMGFPFFGLPPSLLAQISQQHQARNDTAVARGLVVNTCAPTQQHQAPSMVGSLQQHLSMHQKKAMAGAAHLLATLTEATATTAGGAMSEDTSGETVGTGTTVDSACSRETNVYKHMQKNAMRVGCSGASTDRTGAAKNNEQREDSMQPTATGTMTLGRSSTYLTTAVMGAAHGTCCVADAASAEVAAVLAPPAYPRRTYSSHAQRSFENKAKQVSDGDSPQHPSGSGAPSSLTRGFLQWDNCQARQYSGEDGGRAAAGLSRRPQEEGSKQSHQLPELLNGTARNQAEESVVCDSLRRAARQTSFQLNELRKSHALMEGDRDRTSNPTSEEDTNGRNVGGHPANPAKSVREAQCSYPTNGSNGSCGQEDGGEELAACVGNGSAGDGNGSSENGSGDGGNRSSVDGNGSSGNGSSEGQARLGSTIAFGGTVHTFSKGDTRVAFPQPHHQLHHKPSSAFQLVQQQLVQQQALRPAAVAAASSAVPTLDSVAPSDGAGVSSRTDFQDTTSQLDMRGRVHAMLQLQPLVLSSQQQASSTPCLIVAPPVLQGLGKVDSVAAEVAGGGTDASQYPARVGSHAPSRLQSVNSNAMACAGSCNSEQIPPTPRCGAVWQDKESAPLPADGRQQQQQAWSSAPDTRGLYRASSLADLQALLFQQQQRLAQFAHLATGTRPLTHRLDILPLVSLPPAPPLDLKPSFATSQLPLAAGSLLGTSLLSLDSCGGWSPAAPAAALSAFTGLASWLKTPRLPVALPAMPQGASAADAAAEAPLSAAMMSRVHSPTAALLAAVALDEQARREQAAAAALTALATQGGDGRRGDRVSLSKRLSKEPGLKDAGASPMKRQKREPFLG